MLLLSGHDGCSCCKLALARALTPEIYIVFVVASWIICATTQTFDSISIFVNLLRIECVFVFLQCTGIVGGHRAVILHKIYYLRIVGVIIVLLYVQKNQDYTSQIYLIRNDRTVLTMYGYR